MLYVVISDLHLGAPDSFFDLKQFNDLAATNGWTAPENILVLGGDISDGAYLDEKQGSLAIANLDRELNFPNKRFIPGNHDSRCLLPGKTFPEGFSINTRGGLVHFTHGHLCSPYLFAFLEEILPTGCLNLEVLHSAATSVARSIMNMAHTQLSGRPLFQLLLDTISHQPQGENMGRALTGMIKHLAEEVQNRPLRQFSGILGKVLSWYIAGSAPSMARSQALKESPNLVKGIAKYTSLLYPQPDHLIMGHTHQPESGTEIYEPGMAKPVRIWNSGAWQGVGGSGGVVIVDTSAQEPVLITF